MGKPQDPKNLRYGDRRLVSDSDKEFMEKWADEKLEILLVYANLAPGFARHICKRLVETFGSDDKISGFLQKNLIAERRGKKPGAHTKWGMSRLILALTYYNIRMNAGDPRKRVLLELAEMNGLYGKNASTRIARRLKQAQELVDSGIVPKNLCPPELNN